MATAFLNLSELDGSNGFVINGIDQRDRSGRSVSGAGDINGDGIDDLIIGAFGADPNGNLAAGETYVVFGHSEGFKASLNLSELNAIFGSDGDDVLRGDLNQRSPQVGIGGDDIIFGGEGNDRIGGKGGND
ncbi:MAG: integrin alpha [Coleofasciculus sp. B1-GNL1-01]